MAADIRKAAPARLVAAEAVVEEDRIRNRDYPPLNDADYTD